MAGRGVENNCGNIARMWKEPPNEQGPLCERFHVLFNICLDQECVVEKIDSIDQVSFFRRRLTPELLKQWEEVKKEVCLARKNDLPDKIFWNLNTSGTYTTKSMYSWLEKGISGANYKWIWEAKIPLKIQIFLWHLF